MLKFVWYWLFSHQSWKLLNDRKYDICITNQDETEIMKLSYQITLSFAKYTNVYLIKLLLKKSCTFQLHNICWVGQPSENFWRQKSVFFIQNVNFNLCLHSLAEVWLTTVPLIWQCFTLSQYKAHKHDFSLHCLPMSCMWMCQWPPISSFFLEHFSHALLYLSWRMYWNLSLMLVVVLLSICIPLQPDKCYLSVVSEKMVMGLQDTWIL